MQEKSRRAVIFVSGLLVLGAFFFINAGYFLSAPASQPVRADAIIILAGGDGLRSTYGIELFKAGYAVNVVIPAAINKASPEQMDMSDGRREKVFFIAVSKNTYDEAGNSLRLMQARGWRSVIVVTDPPHIRRVDWTWRHVLKGSGLKYLVAGTNPAWWDAGHWWRNDRSRKFVLSEYVKLVYYIMAHGIGITDIRTSQTGNG